MKIKHYMKMKYSIFLERWSWKNQGQGRDNRRVARQSEMAGQGRKGGGGWEELYHRLVRPVPVDTDSCHRKKQRDGKRRWIPAPDQVEGRLCEGMTGGRQADIWDKI